MTIQTEYKTFTASIETPTLLDDFAPIFIEDIAQKFGPIKAIKVEYCDRLEYYANSLKSYQGFESTAKIFHNSVEQMALVFEDFQKRMKYFTLVFFGAVSAGKTSMICDLANMNPHKLTEIISRNPNFNPQQDGISIGPNVATINLYEILIEKSCIRLVDVPGIGGVVHDNNSLAPFVDMADCVIFLLDANSDITKNDYDFIYDHVASMTQSKTEKGLDKKALVVINKWKSLTGGGRPIALVEKDLETKKQWILDGNNSFSGIAGLFSKRPEIVISNTSARDDETGERYPGWEDFLDMEQVVNTLKEILQEEGAILRLNRPRQILLKEINRICEQLEEEKTKRSLNNLIEELNRLGFRIDSVSNNMQVQFDARLNNLVSVISMSLAPQIKRILNNWKPKVGFVNQMKLLVPEWVPGAKNANLGKTAVQNALKEVWQSELRVLIKQGVDLAKIETLIQQEATTLSSLISSTYRLELSGASPELLQKLSALNTSINTDSLGGNDTTVSLNNAIASAVGKIENEVLKDILTILTFDAILAALAGAVFTPVGSALLIAIRRWLKGDKKQKEIKQEIELAVDEAVNSAANNIRVQVASRVRKGIEEAGQNIRNILTEEQQTLTQPMIVIDQAIAELNSFSHKLESLSLR
jgi:signal recognition particle receptor subunit beta